MDIKSLLAAKRAAEICQENKTPISNLAIIAAMKQASIDFSNKGDK